MSKLQAAGILPAVEGGTLPLGSAIEVPSMVAEQPAIPPGETPRSTARRMPPPTSQSRGSV
jgi:hypothetical protein